MQVNRKFALNIITLGMLVIGIFTVVIVKAYYQTYQDSNRQDATLPNLLQLEIENEQLAKENEKLWKELNQIQAGQSAAALASQQLDEGRINAGLENMKGLGVEIILNDADPDSLDPDHVNGYANYVIHEEYLRTLVNVLWNGGAEAIAINGQRITTHSEIFCNGAYIQINGTRQMPPYKIEAIGNQDNLKSALQFPYWDKLGEYQQQFGITRRLNIPDHPIVIPAGRQYSFRYAEPVKEG